MPGAKIVGIGAALPGTNIAGRIVTNTMLSDELRAYRAELVHKGQLQPPDRWDSLPADERALHERRWQLLDTSPEWIEEHTGIQERRFADPGIATSDLATCAAREAMAVAGWMPRDVGFLIIATVLPDHIITPATAPLVQHALGIPITDNGGLRDVDGFDVTCACSSFGKALKVGYAYCAAGLADRGLVIGADVMTRTVNMDRNVHPILGDAGGAVAIERVPDDDDAFHGRASFLGGLDGSLADLIKVPMGGTREPLCDPAVLEDPFDGRHRMRMQGPSVKKGASRLLLARDAETTEGWNNSLLLHGLTHLQCTMGDIDFLAIHQANLRILEPVVAKLRTDFGFHGIAYNNIQRYGNTTSASIPLLLYDAWREGVLRPGMRVLMAVFGGGFAWQTACFRWTLPNPS